MKFRMVVLVAVFALVFSVAACSKQDEAPISTDKSGSILPDGHPSPDGGPSGPGVPGVPDIVPVTEIDIPEGVKGVWVSAVVTIQDRSKGNSEDITIPLNSEYKIADSNLKLVVGDFLPDFRMEGSTITSSSSEPNNPAVQIVILEGEEEIFAGWLYSRFPAIHPFQHEKYSITLKAGVKK